MNKSGIQLKVLKCDGSVEVYYHTKVMGSIAAALGDCNNYYQEGVAEQLADVVTVFLRRHYSSESVSADEIHSMSRLCYNLSFLVYIQYLSEVREGSESWYQLRSR